MAQRGYRLVHERQNQPLTIVHGVRGSRVLVPGRWYEAEVRWRPNPGALAQPHYWTGFHCFRDQATAEVYRGRFKRPPLVVAVDMADTWAKPTNADVVLARWLRVDAEDWARVMAESQEEVV